MTPAAENDYLVSTYEAYVNPHGGPDMGNETKRDVVIIGAGPAGMAMAVELGAMGLDTIVVERRSEEELLHTKSAFFHITPAGTNALLRMANPELLRSIVPHGTVYTKWHYVNGESGKMLRTIERDLSREPGFPLAVERHLLLQGLRPLLRSEQFRFSSPVRRIDPDKGIVFLDDEVIHADLIIGADGVHSRTRKAIFGDTGLQSLGLLSLWAVIPVTDDIRRSLSPEAVYFSGAGFYHTTEDVAHWYLTTRLEKPFVATPPVPEGGWLGFTKRLLKGTGDRGLKTLVDASSESDIIATMSVDREPLEAFTRVAGSCSSAMPPIPLLPTRDRERARPSSTSFY